MAAILWQSMLEKIRRRLGPQASVPSRAASGGQASQAT